MEWKKEGKRYVCQNEPLEGWYIVNQGDDFRSMKGNNWKLYSDVDTPAGDGRTLTELKEKAEGTFVPIIESARRKTAENKS